MGRKHQTGACERAIDVQLRAVARLRQRQRAGEAQGCQPGDLTVQQALAIGAEGSEQGSDGVGALGLDREVQDAARPLVEAAETPLEREGNLLGREEAQRAHMQPTLLRARVDSDVAQRLVAEQQLSDARLQLEVVALNGRREEIVLGVGPGQKRKEVPRRRHAPHDAVQIKAIAVEREDDLTAFLVFGGVASASGNDGGAELQQRVVEANDARFGRNAGEQGNRRIALRFGGLAFQDPRRQCVQALRPEPHLALVVLSERRSGERSLGLDAAGARHAQTRLNDLDVLAAPLGDERDVGDVLAAEFCLLDIDGEPRARGFGEHGAQCLGSPQHGLRQRLFAIGAQLTVEIEPAGGKPHLC